MSIGSEPYRYECPQGHTCVTKRVNDPVGPVTSPMLESRTEGVAPAHKYYCKVCHDGYDELRDKKTDRMMTP